MYVYSFLEPDTIVADASGITWNKVASGSGDYAVAETCTWGSDGLGECVEAIQFPEETTTALTATISGSKFAFATLTESIPTATPTTTQTSANGALTLGSCAKDPIGMVAIVAFVGCLMAF